MHPAEMILTQTFPLHRQAPLRGLYLAENLAEIPPKIGHSLVFADFLTDRNGVIAVVDAQHHSQVPPETKNDSDWQLFQELMAQADVIITGAAYLKRASFPISRAQDVLSQFEPGSKFAELGEWRLKRGQPRSPDVAVITHSLDFAVPTALLNSGRKITIFTSNDEAAPQKAADFTAAGIRVVPSGPAGVEGRILIDTLGQDLGYQVIQMATGPRVLGLLLSADRLDRLYITEAQLEIKAPDPTAVVTILPGDKKVDQLAGFSLVQRYFQEKAVTANGSTISQAFLRFDRNFENH